MSAALIRVGTSAVIGTLLLVAAAQPTSGTQATAVTGFVAVTTGSGSDQIFQFAVDGSHERRLTSGPSAHQYPSLAPNGSHLLYTETDAGQQEIYELDLSRPLVPVAITRPPMTAASASWSPDSKFIVFAAIMPGEEAFQIYRAKPDGSEPTKLTHTIDTGNTQPVVSPDAKRIAFINGGPSTVGGPFGSTIDIQSSRIWVMSGDGSAAAPLTAGPLDAYPAWLDSETLLFARADGLAQNSTVLSVTLSGVESPESPSGQFLIEPRPLPGGTRYGATLVTGGASQLVIVARAHGSAGGLTVTRIDVPAHNGNAFSISWLVSSSNGGGTAAGAQIDVRWGLAIAGLALVLIPLVGWVGMRRWRARDA